MVQTPEGWVKDHIKKILEQHKIHYSMPVTMGYGKSGDPDIHTCMAGLFVTIEAKDDALRHRHGELITRGKNKGKVVTEGGPTALQQDTMRSIRECGGITLLIDRHNFTALHDFILFIHAMPESTTWENLYENVRDEAIRLDIWYNRMPQL